MRKWTRWFVAAAIACLGIAGVAEATGFPTTTTLTSNPTPNAALGVSVTFTATVASSPTPTVGAVTFSESGATLGGGPVSVVNGIATLAISTLPEGDHIILASYHDSSNAFNDSSGMVALRVDKTTSSPTLSGSTWSYCNTGAVTIPAGTTAINDIGPASPNPSNVLVSNLPGTVATASIELVGFSHVLPAGLQSLLVGPNGASAPGTAQTFDFFTNGGGVNVYGPQTTTFSDTGTLLTASAPPAASSSAGSFGVAPTYTASPFFTLPATVQRAQTAGAFTFDTGTRTASAGGVYLNTAPNGTWSLYFDQTIHHAAAGGSSGGWCMKFTVNKVTGNGIPGHVGPAPSNHMRQGGTGSVTLSVTNNGDANGNGSTGDPDGLHGLAVTGILPSGLSFGTVPTGSPWNCITVSQTLSCKSSNAIAAESSYPLLIVPVNVAGNASPSVNVSGFSFSGGGMNTGTFSTDTIIIDPSASLAMVKSHTGTFTQGQTATWRLQVINQSATATGATDGSTVTVVDTLPTGYTAASFTATGWACSGTGVITCTTTAVVAGAGGDFNLITLDVNVPANSPTSVTNSAKVFGGGDLSHTNLGNAAVGSEAVAVIQAPASINLTTGNNQSATVGTAFPLNLSATVLDAGTVPISGVTVTFTAPASGASGTFVGGTNVKTAPTNASGIATATSYSANGTAGGPYNITVSAGAASNHFSETNLAGTASQMTANAGTTPQSAAVSTMFTNPLAVTVKDAGNNPVSGVTVTFTAPASGASGVFSNSTRTIMVATIASGVAAAPFTANGTSGGPYNVTAAASGVTTVNFSLTNTANTPPVLTGQSSRMVHGAAGTFDLALAATPLNPTTEPRGAAGAHTIVFTFDKPVTGGVAAIAEGIATLGVPTFSGSEMTVPLTGVANAQYVTVTVSNVTAADGGTGGSGSVRLGFLLGDVNQNRVVSLADLGLVNAQLAQPVTAANFLNDVNASGTLSLADKGITNANLTKALPAP